MVLLSVSSPRRLFVLISSCLLIFLFLTSSLLVGKAPTTSPITPIQNSSPLAQTAGPGESEALDPSASPSLPPFSEWPALLDSEEGTIPLERIVSENFPYYAEHNKLPGIHPLNVPPPISQRPDTPLFIGFTRNWPILQQSVVSYIAAGWPADQIYVVDNSGTMDSNELGLLTLQNPFYLDYKRLRSWGVNVLTTPTLFTFAQLQNYYIYTAVQKKWEQFFWSHMDSVALSLEDKKPYQSLYSRILKVVEKRDVWKKKKKGRKWAMVHFSYDRLTLVNTKVFKQIGGWDTMIPYYYTDCDMYSRLKMKNYTIDVEKVGYVFDVGGVLEDLHVLFPGPEEFEFMRNSQYKGQEAIPHDDDNHGGNYYRRSKNNEDTFQRELPEASTASTIPSLSTNSESTEESQGFSQTTLALDSISSSSYLGSKPLSEADKARYTKSIFSARWKSLNATLQEMEISKNTASSGRNFWQGRQAGGRGEPFYRDPDGFERAIRMTIWHGARVYATKWGWGEDGDGSCDLLAHGRREADAWARRLD